VTDVAVDGIKQAEVRVRTTAGVVGGTTGEFGSMFRAVPYASPPVGASRFSEPEAVAQWEGERDATAFGPSAPMPDRRRFGDLDMEPFVYRWVPGDDYRTLNVWTPSTSGRAPVVVFVHGGAFLTGSGAAAGYNGSAFARDGVVAVSCNYRLGIPGWLSLPGAPENRGLLDVLGALRWVHENVAAFGGDPEQVTVCGQSAGGMIIGSLLTNPAAEGLFQRAICQSGGLYGHSADQAGNAGRRVADELGVPHTADAFAEIPDERLVTTLTNVVASGALSGLTPIAPVLDRTTVQLNVALLVGNTSQEARLYQNPEREPDINELFRSATEQLVTEYRAAAGAEPFRYLFDWCDGPYGACHAVDLPFVFETTELPELRGPRSLLGPKVPEGLSRRMHRAWVDFVTTGDPGWTGEHRFAE
jgi:para-nitrobenzyl esterase